MARLSISDLPDDLLTEVLSLLEPADLHRAALVSRRWHECVHAPELCASAVNHIHSRRHLQSVLAWLQRHGRHVRRLDLRLWVPVQEQLLGSCPAACAQLEDLCVETWLSYQTLVVGGWAPALNRLQRLALRSILGFLQVTASLHPLTALRKLCLTTQLGVQLAPGVRLPAGLEELQLEDWKSVGLPDQLAGLSALHTLVLKGSSSSADGYGALERLPRLRCLQCSICEHLPACLPRLTGLEELMVFSGNSARLDVALRSLTRLTSLALFRMQPPPSVAGLARLQRACFAYPLSEPPGGYAALPAGPWAGSLRQLGASYDTLLLSGQLLAAAGQLEQVAVMRVPRDFSSTHGAASERFWRWCAEHTPLRQLHIQAPPEPPILAAVEALRGARPALRVHRHLGGSPFSESFFHSI